MPPEHKSRYAGSLKAGFLPVNLDFPDLKVMCIDPPVFVVENFVSAEVCEAMKEACLSSDLMAPSQVGGLGQLNASIRTSTTLAFTAEVLSKVPGIKASLDEVLARASQLIDLQALGQDAGSLQRSLFSKPSVPGQVVTELPQVARYTPGQHFLAHEDAFPSSVATQKAFQRRATLLVYLNDVPQGGATRFEHLGPLDVRPRRGSALLFFPAFSGGRPDARTLHTAVDAVDEKWVFQLWLTSALKPATVPPVGQTAKAGFKDPKAAAAAAAAMARSGAARKKKK